MDVATLSLSLPECWAVRDYVRKHQEYGVVWSRSDMAAIHRAILHLEAHKEQSVYDVALDEGTLWLLEQQVPSALMTGTQPVGRSLLMKVMAALESLTVADEEPPTEEEEVRATEVGEPYQSTFRKDETALEGFEQYIAQKEKEA